MLGVTATASASEPALQFDQAAADFGEVVLGDSATAVFTLTNVSSQPVEVNTAGSAVVPPLQVSRGCGGTLQPGESCTYTYTFTPTVLGPVEGLSAGTRVNGVRHEFSFTGEVVPALQFDQAAADFGEVVLGDSATAVFTLTNVSSQPVDVSTAGSRVDPPLELSHHCNGVTLQPGDSCTYTYTFTPTVLGPVEGLSASTEVNGVRQEFSLTGWVVAAPVPTEPVPTDPVPTEPVPTDPVPTDPVPTDPVPTDPVPTETAPGDGSPTAPSPSPAEASQPELPRTGGHPVTGVMWLLAVLMIGAGVVLRARRGGLTEG